MDTGAYADPPPRPRGRAGIRTPKLERIFDCGEIFLGAVDGDTLAGVAVRRSAAPHAPADRVVISATPARNTVDLSLARGSLVDPSPDPAALAAEPDDVHLLWLRP